MVVCVCVVCVWLPSLLLSEEASSSEFSPNPVLGPAQISKPQRLAAIRGLGKPDAPPVVLLLAVVRSVLSSELPPLREVETPVDRAVEVP